MCKLIQWHFEQLPKNNFKNYNILYTYNFLLISVILIYVVFGVSHRVSSILHINLRNI